MRDARRRLDDLLLARASAGLSDAEAQELERLLAAHPDADQDAYERAAAAVLLATLDTREELPRRVRLALEQRAAEFIAQSAATRR